MKIYNKRTKTLNIKHYTLHEKGLALILVIFAMMLFAVLGWTLAVMQSGDFEVSMRDLDSERALYLAESGGQWALNKLNQDGTFRTTSTLHNLSTGQYNVVISDGQQGTADAGKVLVVSTGYVPTQANPRAMRVVKMAVTSGGVDKALYARYLFDWSGARGNISVNGDTAVTDRCRRPDCCRLDCPGCPDRPDPTDCINCDGYEGNGNTVHNEVADIHVPPYPSGGARDLLPDDSTYPLLVMAFMESNATNVWAPARADEITSISTVVDGGINKSVIVFNGNIFATASPVHDWSQFVNYAVLRNTSLGSWENGSELKCNGITIIERPKSVCQINAVLTDKSVRLTEVVDWEKETEFAWFRKLPQ